MEERKDLLRAWLEKNKDVMARIEEHPDSAVLAERPKKTICGRRIILLYKKKKTLR